MNDLQAEFDRRIDETIRPEILRRRIAREMDGDLRFEDQDIGVNVYREELRRERER